MKLSLWGCERINFARPRVYHNLLNLLKNEKGPLHSEAALFQISVVKNLTLRELEALTRFGFTVFLTFNNTAVTCEEASGFQSTTQRRIV